MSSLSLSTIQRIQRAVNPQRLLDTAIALVEIPSPTCAAGAVAHRLAEILHADGFTVERPVADWPEAPAVVVRAPEFVLSMGIAGSPRNWDLHPDGKRFIAAVADLAPPPPAGAGGASGVPASRYIVVQNWFNELKALSAKAKK